MKNKKQNLIKRKLSESESLDYIQSFVTENGELNRTSIADQLCLHFKFLDPQGKVQRSSCLKALRDLEEMGKIKLPSPLWIKKGGVSHRRLPQAVEEPKGVPERAEQIKGYHFLEVKTENHRRIWNELMLQEHYLGAGPFLGRQLRYLIGSDHGWLGGFGLSSGALYLEARDKWIGWDAETQLSHLDKVVNLSRFLIRPSVRCQNLASMVLGQLVRDFPADFEKSYGYKPLLLESFVDPERYEGTSYQAANWIKVGQSKGLGRYAKKKEQTRSRKDIYVYPLVPDFRAVLSLPVYAGGGPMRLEDSIGEQWAELEFGGAKLGDKRLTSRLVKIAQAKSKQPMKHWLEILGGAAAAIKGFYRLVGNYFLTKSGDKPKIRDRQAKSIDFDTILKPHIEQTKRRMMSYDRVLVIRDQSDLNYSSIKTCDGLGVIGRNQTKTKSKGLSLGTQFVVTTKGLPLGIAGADCVAPKLKPEHKGKDRRYIPLHQKTTQRWVDGLQQCQELGQELRQTTRIVQVCDREADVYDMFEAWSEDKKVELLVRAEHNRRTNEGYKLFELVQQVPEIWRKSVIVKRQSGKPKKGKRSTRPLRPERKVLLAMQYRTVLLHPPDCGLNSKKPPIKVTLIHAWEEKDPPKGEKKIDWYLISTATNLTKDEAWERVSWYCLRWRIEDFHRVLKSGCLIEDFQFEKADRLKNAIAICMVVAWRIMALTLLGREAPELPADIFYSETEQEIIECLVKKKVDL